MGNFFKKLVGLNPEKINIENEEAFLEENNREADKADNEEWDSDNYEEGQLSIDVYQTQKSIIVKSTIAGVNPEDVDISINNDMLTIRGKREEKKQTNSDDYLYKECYWGAFSRSIILPVEIEANKIEAILENGVLTVVLPKSKTSKRISVKVK